MTNCGEIVDDDIVIMGCGWIAPFAFGSMADVLRAGRVVEASQNKGAYYRPIDENLISRLSVVSAELRRDKLSWIAALGIEQAAREAKLPLEQLKSPRVGLALGCAAAGQLGMLRFAEDVRTQGVRFVSPINFPQTVGNYSAGAIARHFSIRGPNVTFASGDASGYFCLVEARGYLERNEVDLMLVGGCDVFSEVAAHGLRHLDLVASEGACFLVLERGRGARDRGAMPLAHLRSLQTGEFLNAPSIDTRELIVSRAPRANGGEIGIAAWLGLCPSAMTTGAIAAAIGAGQGEPVPIVDAEGRVTARCFAKPTNRDAIPARVIIDSGEGWVAQIELDVSQLRSD